MKDAIRQIFVSQIGIDQLLFTEELTYNSIPEWDSAAHMDILIAIEEHFGVELEPDEMVAMTSIVKIYETLERKGVAVE